MRIVANLTIMMILSGLAAWAADAKAGQAVYARACRSCHGADGVPVAAAAKMLKAEMKDLKTVTGSISEADMKKIVAEGKGKMAPVKGIAGADLDNVIAYTKSLK